MTLFSNISRSVFITSILILVSIKVFIDTIFYFIFSTKTTFYLTWSFFSSIIILAIFIFYFFSNQLDTLSNNYSNDKFVLNYTRVFFILLILLLLSLILPNNSSIYFFDRPYFKFVVSDITSVFFVFVSVYLSWFLFSWLFFKRHKRTSLYLKIIGLSFIVLFIIELINFFINKNEILETTSAIAYLVIFIFVLLVTKKNNWIAQLPRKQKIRMLWVSLAVVVVTFIISNWALQYDSFLAKDIATFMVGGFNFFSAVILSVNAFSLRLFFAVIAALPTATIVERKTSEIFSLAYLNKFIAETASKNTDELMQIVVQLAQNATGGAGAWIELYDKGDLRLGATTNIIPEAISNFHSDKKIGYIFTTIDKPILIESVSENEEIKTILQYLPFANTIIAVPIYQGKTRYGTLITVDSEEYGFEAEDVSVLAAFADNVNLALENQRLLQESIEKERYRSEMLIAKRIQQELLPQKLPEFDNFQIVAYSSPAEEVGGDYYDVTYFADGSPCILIGDVSGKGIGAAFYMAQLKGAVHSIAPHTYSPRQLLIKINEILYNLMDKQSYITISCLKLDESNGKITFARAGHTPAFYKTDTNVVTLLPKGLGIALVNNDFFETNLEEITLNVEDNSLFFMITDGVNEIHNTNGEEIDFNKIVDFLQQNNYSAPKILDKFLDFINEFRNGSAQYDDLTIVAISFNSSKQIKG